MGRKIFGGALVALLVALGACHDQQTREQIRNGDFDRPADANDAAPAAPAQPQ